MNAPRFSAELLPPLPPIAGLPPPARPVRCRPDGLPEDPADLLRLYALGWFPMPARDSDARYLWVQGAERAVLPPDRLRISRSLARTLRRGRFQVTRDTDFRATVQGCADRPSSWIRPSLQDQLRALHGMGFAHSVEVRDAGRLVGGLYGLALGRVFFGESMFSRARDASKVALVHLAVRLQQGGFAMLDVQFLTPHLARLGAVAIDRARFRARLRELVGENADFAALPDSLAPQEVLQRSTQMS